MALFGCAFYLTIGTQIIDFAWTPANEGGQRIMCTELGKALGSLSVIGSFVYFVDAIFGGLDLHKSRLSEVFRSC